MTRHELSAGLKAYARNSLLGNLPVAVGSEFTFLLFHYALMQICNSAVSGLGNVTFILSLVVTYMVSVFTGTLRYGLYSVYLKLQYGMKATGREIFVGFSENSQKITKIQMILSAIELFCIIPGNMVIFFTAGLRYMALGLVLIVIGGIAYSMVTVSLMPAYFLLLDYPDLTAKQAIYKSIQLMQGNQTLLIYIIFSFAPLYILSVLSLGIANFWIAAYKNATLAAFYRGLISSGSKAQS